MGSHRFIISGGGTGGHIYPAIAIADALKKRHPQAEFLFVGARDRMEMEKVPQAGYRIKGLWISGVQRSITTGNLLFPIKLIKSMWDAKKIIQEFKPHLAIGTGGFASGPTLKAAARAKVPYVLQEQNSFAGITNRLLAKKAEKIFVAYDGMERFFPKEKIVKTGNPIRENLVVEGMDKNEGKETFGFQKERPVLLVMGGSLGARRINQLIEAKLGFFKKLGVQLLWQCGKLYFEEYKKHGAGTVKVKAFLNRMGAAYAAADLIISRAGAGAVSELCIVGKPTLFVPSPNLAEDHQTKNAMALAEKNAALLLPEKQLDTDFENVFTELFQSKAMQEKLSANIKKLAMPRATEHIVDEITQSPSPLTPKGGTWEREIGINEK